MENTIQLKISKQDIINQTYQRYHDSLKYEHKQARAACEKKWNDIIKLLIAQAEKENQIVLEAFEEQFKGSTRSNTLRYSYGSEDIARKILRGESHFVTVEIQIYPKGSQSRVGELTVRVDFETKDLKNAIAELKVLHDRANELELKVRDCNSSEHKARIMREAIIDTPEGKRLLEYIDALNKKVIDSQKLLGG